MYRYTGRQLDLETGHYYYRNRYYDPQSGRFLTADPIGLEGGDVNLYRYVKNRSINFTDPDGKETVSIIVGGLILTIIPDNIGDEPELPRYQVEPIAPELSPGNLKDRKKEERKIERENNLEKNSCRMT